MNKSQPAQIIAFSLRKSLIQVGNEFITNAVGVFSFDDVVSAIREYAESQISKEQFFDEACKSIGRDLINNRSKPRLVDQYDWVGYGDMTIKLPETKIVTVRYAELPALDHRKKNVLDNMQNIVRAAEEEVRRIDRITKMMVSIGAQYAGTALDILRDLDSK